MCIYICFYIYIYNFIRIRSKATVFGGGSALRSDVSNHPVALAHNFLKYSISSMIFDVCKNGKKNPVILETSVTCRAIESSPRTEKHFFHNKKVQ
jgi:hypothetical protein